MFENMIENNPDIVILHDKAHGIPTTELADALRERLPNYDIRMAQTLHKERELVRHAPVVAGLGIDADLVDVAEELEYFACGAAGTDHLPMDQLAKKGVTVTNASGVHGPNIAEHVIGWMLMITRRLDEGLRRQQNREWRHFQAFGELKESTITIVGLGSIGTSIAERLEAFGVYTIGVRYTSSKGGPTNEVIGFDTEDFHEALTRTDYLVISCPLSDTTSGLLDTEEFNTLPERAVVINIGRGPIIETDALVNALQDNEIHKAAIDVTDPEPLPENHPLWNLENVLITPHVSGHTDKYWTRNANIIVQNIQIATENGGYHNLENQVLDPEQ
jgi:phosphoglycerate dehydrogenase-like enzyme